MGYFAEIRAVLLYIENHLQDGGPRMDALERAAGFSLAHIREIFVKQTGVPLKRFIQQSKLERSAFDLLHTRQRVLDIAVKYGFKSHETYSRAFKKMTGLSPAQFRKLQLPHERKLIRMSTQPTTHEGSTILYGVPRVEYGENCTPYPLCLKSCASYLGEDLDYPFVMAASGAAFRLTWNTKQWDMGNVDIFHALSESHDIYRLGVQALGRSFEILERGPDTAKEEFISFIKARIDAGLPCIALGVIGPPEACIIAGYRENGGRLLSWNCFQHDPDFCGNIEFDGCGYFDCGVWWENADTRAVMCMGGPHGEKKPIRDVIKTAEAILRPRTDGDYAKGLLAYDAWKTAMLDDGGFSPDGNLSALYERNACVGDALSCLLDGRGCAAAFFARLSDRGEAHKELYREAALAFDRVFRTAQEMLTLFGGWDRSEGNVRRTAQKDVRAALARLIDRSKEQDAAAFEALKDLGAAL